MFHDSWFMFAYVMGFENGTLTSTASATKFSISRSMERLYLDLMYSGFAAYRQAMRPPRGVMPTRSPIPRTAVGHVSKPLHVLPALKTHRYRYVSHQPPTRYKHWRWLGNVFSKGIITTGNEDLPMPVSLCKWTSMSQPTTPRSVRMSS